MKLLNKVFKTHSSDFKCLQQNRYGVRLKFNLHEWEVEEMTENMCRKYLNCVQDQLGISINTVGTLKSEDVWCLPRSSDILDMSVTYTPTTREILRPLELIGNYEIFYKYIYRSRVNNYITKVVSLMVHGDNTTDKWFLLNAKASYECLVRMFENESLFQDIQNHKQAENINLWIGRSLNMFSTGLCNTVSKVKMNYAVKESVRKHINKYCDLGTYYKSVNGFDVHIDLKTGFDLPECIESCKARLELIDLMLNDLKEEQQC